MYLETLGVDIPMNTNDPRFSEDADYQGVWNPVVIARHVIQHRKTPLYSAYEFPRASKVLLPGQWDWMEREHEKRARQAKPVPTLIPENVKKIDGDDLLLGGWYSRAKRRARRLSRNPLLNPGGYAAGKIMGKRRARRLTLSGDDLLLGGWLTRMKRKARNVTHSALNVATKIPGVNVYANMARAGLNAAQQVADQATGTTSALRSLRGKALGNLRATGFDTTIPGAEQGRYKAENPALSMENLPTQAANMLLMANNSLPAASGGIYNSASTLPALQEAADKLVVPQNLPAKHVVQEIDATKTGWINTHKNQLLIAGLALSAIGAAATLAVRTHRKAQIPSIVEMGENAERGE